MSAGRKQRGAVATLPFELREQVCERLRDNEALQKIAEWLFGVSSREGVPYSVIWTEHRSNEEVAVERLRALKCCVQSLSRYRQADEYQSWLIQDNRDSVLGGMMTNLLALTKTTEKVDAAAVVGSTTQIALSATMEVLGKLSQGKMTADDLNSFSLTLSRLNRTLVAQVNSETAVKNSEINAGRAETSKEQARLARERFETEVATRLLNEATCTRIAAIAQSSLPQADKIAAIRREYFADVDAVEQSGEVKLPV